jgi:hypothetical protein
MNNTTTTAILPMMLSGHHFLFVAKDPSKCQLDRQRTRAKGASMGDSQAEITADCATGGAVK